MSARDAKTRFVARDHEGTILRRCEQRRQALDVARQTARLTGRECEVADTMALVGAVCLWIVSPSGAVQAAELRSIESEKRDAQEGAAR